MNFLNANPTIAIYITDVVAGVCAGTVAAEAAANEGDTMSLGGFEE